MGETKRLKAQIASLKERIAEHDLKISEELERPRPNQGDIYHWKAEIAAWESQISHKEARLRKRRRRG